MLKEQSIDLPFSSLETDPPTREIGTDPMEPVPSTLPIIIKTTDNNQNPILLIQTANQSSTEYFNFQIDSSSLTTTDYPMEDGSPLTPPSSSESRSNSPDNSQNNVYSSMLTDLEVKFKKK
jgi:hypothetical protein